MDLSLDVSVQKAGEPGEVSYQFRLKPGEGVKIGRSQGADLVVDDRNISRHHCTLHYSGEHLLLQDQSKNGTFVNAVRIKDPCPVTESDAIQIGQTVLRVRYQVRPRTTTMDVGLLGATFHGYRIESVLGKGNLGVVYKAVQEKMNRPVAIKTLAGRHLTNPSMIDRFLRMSKIAGQLGHPNIVQVFDSGFLEEYQLYYVVMEYVEGKSLTDILKDRPAMTIEEAAPIFLQLGQALAYANRKRIVHRDVNPSNVLVGDNGLVKLVGLGLAKSLEGEVVALTQAGMAMGMIHYISYEQIEDSSKADHRSDIYSLGALFYRTLCGDPPHASGSKREFFEKMKNRELPAPPCERKPSVGRDVSDLVMKCLAVDPAGRYQDAEEFVRDLRAMTAGRVISRESLVRARSNLMAMFPSQVEIPGFRVEIVYRPSEEIGGDLYDIFPVDGGKLAIVQADVTGHGFEAAVVVGMAKTYLKVHGRTGDSPSEVLRRVNEEIYHELGTSTFLTAFFGVLDLDTRRLTFARAGHTPLVVYNPRFTPPVRRLEPFGTIVGMLDAEFFRAEEESVDLVPGDCILLWTDGVHETTNEADEELGMDRTIQAVSAAGSSGAREVVARILEAVDAYQGPRPQRDDITILAIEVLPS